MIFSKAIVKSVYILEHKATIDNDVDFNKQAIEFYDSMKKIPMTFDDMEETMSMMTDFISDIESGLVGNADADDD